MIATTAKLAELLKAASPGPWTTDGNGQETQYVYPTFQRDRSIGFAVFARSLHGTSPRIAWFHATDADLSKESEHNAKLAALAPALALLVVTLSGELKYLTGMLADGAIPSGADMVNALDAIADVEKLEL